MVSFERECYKLRVCLSVTSYFLDEVKQFGFPITLSGRITKLGKVFEKKNEDALQKKVNLEALSLVVRSLMSEFEDNEVGLTRRQDVLWEEHATLINQLHAVSDKDLKEVVFNNVLGQLKSLVPGLKAFS